MSVDDPWLTVHLCADLIDFDEMIFRSTLNALYMQILDDFWLPVWDKAKCLASITCVGFCDDEGRR